MVAFALTDALKEEGQNDKTTFNLAQSLSYGSGVLKMCLIRRSPLGSEATQHHII